MSDTDIFIDSNEYEVHFSEKGFIDSIILKESGLELLSEGVYLTIEQQGGERKRLYGTCSKSSVSGPFYQIVNCEYDQYDTRVKSSWVFPYGALFRVNVEYTPERLILGSEMVFSNISDGYITSDHSLLPFVEQGLDIDITPEKAFCSIVYEDTYFQAMHQAARYEIYSDPEGHTLFSRDLTNDGVHEAVFVFFKRDISPELLINQSIRLGFEHVSFGNLDKAELYFQKSLKTSLNVDYGYGVTTSIQGLNLIKHIKYDFARYELDSQYSKGRTGILRLFDEIMKENYSALPEIAFETMAVYETMLSYDMPAESKDLIRGEIRLAQFFDSYGRYMVGEGVYHKDAALLHLKKASDVFLEINAVDPLLEVIGVRLLISPDYMTNRECEALARILSIEYYDKDPFIVGLENSMTIRVDNTNVSSKIFSDSIRSQYFSLNLEDVRSQGFTLDQDVPLDIRLDNIMFDYPGVFLEDVELIYEEYSCGSIGTVNKDIKATIYWKLKNMLNNLGYVDTIIAFFGYILGLLTSNKVREICTNLKNKYGRIEE